MWAQIIKMRLRPGKDAELVVLMDQLKAAEQAGSGLLGLVSGIRDANRF